MIATVRLSGCDDSTSVQIEVTEDGFFLLEQLAELSHEASEYGCQPTLSVSVVEGN